MKYLDVDGVGSVSRIGLGTWQFGSREWGYGDNVAAGEDVRVLDPAMGALAWGAVRPLLQWTPSTALSETAARDLVLRAQR